MTWMYALTIALGCVGVFAILIQVAATKRKHASDEAWASTPIRYTQPGAYDYDRMIVSKRRSEAIHELVKKAHQR